MDGMTVSLSPSLMHLLLMKPPETKAVSQSIMPFGCCFFSPNWYLLLKQDLHTWNDRNDKEMLAYLYNAKRLAFVCLSKWELQIEREPERDCSVSALILHRKTLWHTQRCFKRSHLTPFSDNLFALRLYYLSSPWNTLELYSALKGQELAKIQNIYSAKLLQIRARYMSHLPRNDQK